MFDELEKYLFTNHFFVKQSADLKVVCNAPSDKSGVYVVYALKNGHPELIYIGCSGKKGKDSVISVRKAGLGGIKDRIVNGYQFGRIPRRISWINQMKIERIEALDVYWFITQDAIFNDCPRQIEKIILQKYFDIYGEYPRWNKQG